MKSYTSHFLVFVAILSASAAPSIAFGAEAKAGVVLLHGSGDPTKHIGGLVGKLESNGILVVHPEMPWSSNRHYDKSVDSAVEQVKSAIAKLKEQGATKFFVGGHSKGGVFALYYASKHPVDGLIAIAPGGNVGGKRFKKEIGKSVAKARKLVDSGKGDKIDTFQDLEGARGVTDVEAPAAAYFSWFDPDGAMNSKKSAQSISASVPILWIVAKNDYSGLRKVNIPMFEMFPSNPKSRFYEPSADHKSAPVDSADEIIRWIATVN